MIPRDVVKLAFQFQESSEVPFQFDPQPEQAAALDAHYGSDAWHLKAPPYVRHISMIDGYLSRDGMEDLPGGLQRDRFGCVWRMGSISHLEEPPLKEASLDGYKLPDIQQYIRRQMQPVWQDELNTNNESFRVVAWAFGLFERSWTLRGFEQLLMDLYDNPKFCEELLEAVADWMLQGVESILSVPLDGIFLTDDYADQRGVIFGLEKFRKLFKPHWKRIFARIRRAGVYSILHVCGNASPAVPDLIECGLDCLESLQPEAMDVYKLKREFGKDIRLWGGLGAQRVLPFGTPEEVRTEVRRLKTELGRGGGYILAGAKSILEDVPTGNVVAYLEEASARTHRDSV